ncbi:MAG: tRNA 2-thiouridine(34) synthase MnmA [Candidatus Paceibacterota bacterium]|jgi:tRNA-specific 2-thiouridylase
MKSQEVKKVYPERSRRVFVGLSGGVDSSVSAALLKKAGYEVTGVFIKGWHPDWGPCGWQEDRLDAMRVCAHLGIPFCDLDLSKEYKKEVVDYMIDEYKVGRTPNPDVMCNQKIKFGAFFDWASAQGANFVATGHYAQIKNLKLKISKDKNKDQTYFLWTLTQRELSRTLFPVGGMIKSEVRKLAKKFGLPTAEKKDSQGLCFVGKVDLPDFLSHFLKPKRGDVLLAPNGVEGGKGGTKIGWHKGVFFLTIGQRHGFTITKKTPNDLPYYIVAKDVRKNTITVSHKLFPQRSDLSLTSRSDLANSVVLRDVNWISPIFDFRGQTSNSRRGLTSPNLFARFRYRQPLQEIHLKNKRLNLKSVERFNLEIRFQKPQPAIAPGQSLVIYSKTEECLGGGIIV